MRVNKPRNQNMVVFSAPNYAKLFIISIFQMTLKWLIAKEVFFCLFVFKAGKTEVLHFSWFKKSSAEHLYKFFFHVQKETTFMFMISNSLQLRKVLQQSGKIKWKTICLPICVESNVMVKLELLRRVGITLIFLLTIECFWWCYYYLKHSFFILGVLSLYFKL